MYWKLPCLVLGWILVMNASAFAQGCSWCTSVVETCCNGTRTDLLYTLPCATSNIYYYYNGPANDWVEILIFEVTENGDVFLASQTGACDCAKSQIYSGATKSSGTVLKFSVYCSGCPGHACDDGNITVKFYTPSSNNCAPNCNIE